MTMTLKKSEEELQALFAKVHQTAHAQAAQHRAMRQTTPAHAQPRPMTSHPLAPGRIVPSSDFSVIQDRKRNGVPSIGLAPPRPSSPQSAEEGLYTQHRSMTGLSPNQRSNTILIDWAVDDNAAGDPILKPVLQFNGTTDETDMLTITLGGPTYVTPPDPDALVPPGAGVVQALLSWGVGDVQYSATVDWILGTVISLTANYLSITAKVGSQATFPPLLPNMTLGAAVAYGAVPGHRNRAVFSESKQGTVNTLLTFGIPNFATSMGVNSSPPAGSIAPVGTPAALPLHFSFQDNNNANRRWDYTYTNADNLGIQGDDIYNVPNGARQVTFGGTGAGGALSANCTITCFFDLCF